MKSATLMVKIKQNGITKKALSSRIGVSRTALDDKLSGKTEFKVPEVASMAEILGLSSADVWDIFFAKEVD